MLGQRIEGDEAIDDSAQGLGLLPIGTRFARSKRTEKTSVRFRRLAEPWAALAEKRVVGYQIRHGESSATGRAVEALPGGLGFIEGPVLGIYLHGLFEQPELLRALFGESPVQSIQDSLEELADVVEERLDITALLERVG